MGHESSVSVGDPELLAELGRHPLKLDTQIGPFDRACGDQLVGHPAGVVHRDGEADAVVSTAAGGDGGVDADHFSPQVDERTAAVAGIDGRVGLQIALTFVDARVAAFGTDDAGRDGCADVEGVPQSEDPITDLHFIAVAQRNMREGLPGVDTNDGDIRARIGVPVGGGQFTTVLPFDDHPIRPIDDMGVRENDATTIDDEAGAGAMLRRHLSLPALLKLFESIEVLAKEPLEDLILNRRPPSRLVDGDGFRPCLDGDDRRQHRLGDAAERHG